MGAGIKYKENLHKSWEPPREYPINLILPESRVIGLHLRRWYYGSSFKFSWWAPKNGCVLAYWPFKVIQGRWFWHQSKTRMPLPVGHQYSNLGPILPLFRDIAGFLLRRATPPLFHPNFRGIPLGLDCWCCVSRYEDPKLIIRVINFELVKPICSRYHNVSVRRTEGRTTYDSNTALELRASRDNDSVLTIVRAAIAMRWCHLFWSTLYYRHKVYMLKKCRPYGTDMFTVRIRGCSLNRTWWYLPRQ